MEEKNHYHESYELQTANGTTTKQHQQQWRRHEEERNSKKRYNADYYLCNSIYTNYIASKRRRKCQLNGQKSVLHKLATIHSFVVFCCLLPSNWIESCGFLEAATTKRKIHKRETKTEEQLASLCSDMAFFFWRISLFNWKHLARMIFDILKRMLIIQVWYSSRTLYRNEYKTSSTTTIT